MRHYDRAGEIGRIIFWYVSEHEKLAYSCTMYGKRRVCEVSREKRGNAKSLIGMEMEGAAAVARD